MTPLDQENLREAFAARYPILPGRSEVREWMREVRWILDLSSGGMNMAYRIIDQEMQRAFGIGWF